MKGCKRLKVIYFMNTDFLINYEIRSMINELSKECRKLNELACEVDLFENDIPMSWELLNSMLKVRIVQFFDACKKIKKIRVSDNRSERTKVYKNHHYRLQGSE